MQAVAPAPPQIEAEVELGRGLDQHPAGHASGARWSFAAKATKSSGVRASRRGHRRAGPAPQRGSRRRQRAGRASSSERARDLRRWAKASRTRRAWPGRRPARCGACASMADATRGRGLNTAGSTVRSRRTSRRAGRARSATHRCGCRARREGDRRSPAGPSPSSAAGGQLPRSCAGSQASRPSREGSRPSQSAPGRAPASRTSSRRPSAASTFGRAATAASASSSPRSISTAWTWAADVRQPLGQHPFPRPHLEHDVAGLGSESRRMASSRFGSARKFWPSRPGARSPAEERLRVGLDRALQLLVGDAAHLGDPSAVCDDMGGLVRLAAHLLRRQERSVGLDQEQVVGKLRRRLSQGIGGRVGDDAREGAVPAALDRVAAPARGARKQCRMTVTPSARASRMSKTSSDGARLAVGVARMDDDRQFGSPAISICASKARRCSCAARRSR